MRASLKTLATLLAAVSLIAGLPLLGSLAAGLPLARYLEFPPLTHYVEHAGFSWPVFAGLALLILCVFLPFIVRILFGSYQTTPGAGMAVARRFETPCPCTPAKLSMQAVILNAAKDLCGISHLGRDSSSRPPGESGLGMTTQHKAGPARRFPAWGWLGLIFGIGTWVLAWSRFPWFAPLQAFTFSPLWFAYIAVVNALAWRRAGRCMLTHETRLFLALFPVSAAFWWLFEYLNRFVQNWHYAGIGSLTPLEYFLYATMPFATVLPAVLGTCRLLETFPRLPAGLSGFPARPWVRSRRTALVVLILSTCGLAGIGVWPDFLFPLLWLAPLGLLASLQVLAGRPPALLAGPAAGDWRRVALLALAALICGVFWEMWNFYSAARWLYAVPFVNRFYVFEMPLLGYAGYLPFGLECALVADIVQERISRNERHP